MCLRRVFRVVSLCRVLLSCPPVVSSRRVFLSCLLVSSVFKFMSCPPVPSSRRVFVSCPCSVLVSCLRGVSRRVLVACLRGVSQRAVTLCRVFVSCPRGVRRVERKVWRVVCGLSASHESLLSELSTCSRGWSLGKGRQRRS